ncbi:ras association domain-containing protein 8 isoform X1 [Oncorhynchus mykiss]|uniref:Ras association domain family member 8 n=2 Tax=Oncorhynchus TaxID=8016 RepID=A0A8C7DDX5_ONCKI|nr:ras association domain-containing protein 8 isoform X1 [Oncorhynchus kisutch]XP_020336573.1 ras association domain-containing protein 8 isoform X1 [Oncorhynchus kisutch]XP_021456790.1 ras association domain-containing protein 8 isoform X1 [Oncorhynchus mykiss]
MELKVWVDGVQRVVCGVTEATTCQEVVIALAQAIGRTGRYTLVEKWRDTERHLAPHESPVASLNTWGQYAGDVQLILHRTGPSLTERPPSEGPLLRGPERGPHRQSLPPLAKLRHPSEHALHRREPRRKSLTFTGGPRGLRDILSGGRVGEGREFEAKRRLLFQGNGGNQNHHHHAAAAATAVAPGGAVSPGMWACRMEDLVRLVGLQRETLAVLEKRLEAYEAELQTWGGRRGEEARGAGGLMEEIVRLERRLRKNEVEMEEEEFWASELQIELESERQLEDRLEELRGRLQCAQVELGDRMALVQGVEAGLEEERLQRERQETQRVSEVEAKAQVLRARTELKAQDRQSVQLESSCRAVDRSLGLSGKRLQDMQHELEQLTKELRQVNLQQFIQQTGTKVTVLPAEPSEEEEETTHTGQGTDLVPLSGSLKRPVSFHPMPGHLRVLHSPLTSGLNPEGIYV